MRAAADRKADALARLEREPNVWVATASVDGLPHLIPLSLCWDGVRILVGTPSDSPTARNALASGRARASLDSAADVLIIDADVEVLDFDTASEQLVQVYVGRVGWNPADEPGPWSLLVMTPRTMLTWNSVAEIEGRTIMRGGTWTA